MPVLSYSAQAGSVSDRQLNELNVGRRRMEMNFVGRVFEKPSLKHRIRAEDRETWAQKRRVTEMGNEADNALQSDGLVS